MNIYLLIIIVIMFVVSAGNKIEFENKKSEICWVITSYVLLLIQILLLVFGVIL